MLLGAGGRGTIRSLEQAGRKNPERGQRAAKKEWENERDIQTRNPGAQRLGRNASSAQECKGQRKKGTSTHVVDVNCGKQFKGPKGLVSLLGVLRGLLSRGQRNGGKNLGLLTK